MIKNIGNKTIDSPGQEATWNRGDIKIPVDQAATSMRIKFVQEVINKGSAATLTLTQRNLLLASIGLDWQYGRGGSKAIRTPLAKRDLNAVRRFQRDVIAIDMADYTNVTTGLARTIAAGTSSVPSVTLVTFTVEVSTGEVARIIQAPFGAGRMQWLMTQLQVIRGSDPLSASSFTLGKLTIELKPLLVQTNGDYYHFFPEYVDANPTDRTYQFPDGYYTAINERSSAHASTALNEYALNVDDEPVHTQANPQDVLEEYQRRDALVTELEDVSNEVTRLYALTSNTPFNHVRTGRPLFSQTNQDLRPMQFTWTYQPVPSHNEVKDVVEGAAELAIHKAGAKLKAVSWAAVKGVEMESRFLPFVPMVFFDANDKEFSKFPGIVCEKGGTPKVDIPLKLLLEARSRYAQYLQAKDNPGARKVVESIASAVPGSVGGGRGFKSGPTPNFTEVQRLITEPLSNLPEVVEALKKLS